MQSLASQRFETFWSQVAQSRADQKLAIIGSENPLHFNCVKNKHLCHFISNEKDTLKEAKNLGFEISTILNHYYDIIVLELTKSRETNLGLIALAEECLKDGGKMIINGDNRIGIKSFLQNISNQWPPEITLIKKKGRIAPYQKKKTIIWPMEKISRFR